MTVQIPRQLLGTSNSQINKVTIHAHAQAPHICLILHFPVHTFASPSKHLMSMLTVKGITGLYPPHTSAEGPIAVIVWPARAAGSSNSSPPQLLATVRTGATIFTRSAQRPFTDSQQENGHEVLIFFNTASPMPAPKRAGHRRKSHLQMFTKFL